MDFVLVGLDWTGIWLGGVPGRETGLEWRIVIPDVVFVLIPPLSSIHPFIHPSKSPDSISIPRELSTSSVKEISRGSRRLTCMVLGRF
jgi:hypothetical protein